MYKAVLIGLGKIAWKMGSDPLSNSSLCHKDAFEKNNKTYLVGGFSPSNSDLEEFSEPTGIKGYSDLLEMLEELRPDIVSICSPDENHSEHLKECINNKVPMIWLEKPATTSVADTINLEKLRCSMSPSSKVLVNFQRRYTDSYQKMRDIISKELYGKCLSVNVNYSRGLVVNGSHMLDIISYLFPVQSVNLLWVEKGINLKSPSFVLSLTKNIIIQVSGIESTFHNIDLSITFEQARISIIHGGMTLRIEEVREHDLFSGYYRLYDEKSYVLGKGGFDFAFDKALDNLIKSFETNSEPLSNLTTSLHGQGFVEMVLSQSAEL